jgi:cobalt-zinc-cadmium efflux system outer membrane protein
VSTWSATSALIAVVVSSASITAQQLPEGSAMANRYVDPVGGLSLDAAIARALQQEPDLRAARAGIDVARGMRTQASLRPNPTVSFERRDEPAGADSQTSVGVEWPLDLFRRPGRVAVAERELEAAEAMAADRERILAAEVRMQYGVLLASVRDLLVLDELATVTRRELDLLRARVEEGAAAPLDRDLLEVELRRLESDRLLQGGRSEAAVVALKRVLGMRPEERLTVRDSLEEMVRRDASPQPPPAGTPEMRADVREAAARVEAATAKVGRAQAEGRFDVSLFAGYMRMNAGFPQRGIGPDGNLQPIHGTFHNVAAGAMIAVPLWNRNQGEVAAAQAERQQALAMHDGTRLTAEAELAAARAQDAAAQEAVTIYSSEARKLARQNLAIVTQSYELGRVTVFEVLAERRRYLDVERGHTDALRAAYEARTALQRARGGVR